MEEPIIRVNDVSMRFNLAQEKTETLKEYTVKLLKHQLFFNEFYALNNVSFDVQKGESVALIGRNGSGKSTMLKVIAGVMYPTTGSVEGVGRVAAVFQEDRLCPQLNAVQNVTLVLPGTENQYKEQIIRDFQQIGIELAALQLPARRLSGGQKRRVALLRALWTPSDTLLLDEPFTGMDPDTLQRAAALLRQRCAGKPVLLATHDESAIRALGWPVVELEKLER